MAKHYNPDILIEKHIKYWLFMLKAMPSQLASLDTNRMMILYFALSALDIMDQLHLIENKKQSIVEWIYSQQIDSTFIQGNTKQTRKSNVTCGFIGGGFMGPMNVENSYLQSHISMTYTALCCLIILGDDLSRVNKKSIIKSLAELKDDNGCFQAVSFGSENDTRFIFCAVAISYILDDFSAIDIDRTVNYIVKSQSFDGGIALHPDLEGHGGSTYCGLASLKLLNSLNKLPHMDLTKRFCVNRMVGGFNGRVNKPADTCYTFWVGGSLQVLDLQDEIDRDSTREFLLQCQNAKMGGFSKLPGNYPDPLHCYYSICGLSLIGEPGFQPIDARLGLTTRAFNSIKRNNNI